MSRRGLRLLAALLLLASLLALAARAQDEAGEDDLEGTAEADSVVLDEFELARLAAAAADSIASATAGADAPFFVSLRNEPVVGVQAGVVKVRSYASLTNTFSFRQGSSLRDALDYAYESFRKQDKTVERRAGRVNYTSGTQLPLRVDVTGAWDWHEDVTINTAGLRNLDRRDAKTGSVGLSRTELTLAGVRHDLRIAGDILDQKAVNQRQRNDVRDAAVNAALRSRARLVDGINLATRLYAVQREGTSYLGSESSPSSTTGDTLGAGVYYDRSRVKGSVVVTQSNLDRRYLDFRRNSSGIIDTLFVPPGESKIVEELHARDLLSLAWDNAIERGRVKLSSRLGRTMDNEEYRYSQVGFRENLADVAELALSFPVGRDSLSLKYSYKWAWDDQIFQGATDARGRQYSKTRDLKVDWRRPLFRNTTLTGTYVAGLAQETAENRYNQNDRDRLTEDASLKLNTVWKNKLTTNMYFQYRSTQDINLRASKSSNNNFRKTFEVSPSYTWPVAPWLSVAQVFRLYIQYQDYTYADWPGVNKDDNYNKRGNLTTTVTVKPTARLNVTARHDHGSRFNATRSSTDVTGHDFYRRDQEQFSSRIDLEFTYKLSPWLTVDASTYRAKDTLNAFGASARETVNYSGEMTIGTTLSRTWAGKNPLTLAGKVMKHQAYGPNVTETNRDYWDADVSLKWSF